MGPVPKALGTGPNWKVYISGCWAFKEGKAQDDFFDLYPELIEYKEKIEILWEDPEGPHSVSPNRREEKKISFDKISPLLQKIGARGEVWLYTKKFVLIQWGCDSFCSFCLTVKKRWRHYYRAKEDIAEEIEKFSQSWWKEVVLTWINLCAWWLKSTNPKPPSNSPLCKEGGQFVVEKFEEVESRFAELLEYLLENTSIKRLRISSIWPEFVDEKLLKIFENKRIYPHFHFSVQSGSTKNLNNMKRHYTASFLKNILLKLRSIKREDWVKISIWADIIVGFPWETEEDFQKTLDLVSDCKITKVHAFPFSAHKLWENVPAWFYKEQISDKVKKERMNRILKLADKVREDFIKENIWNTFEILVEQTHPKPLPSKEGGVNWKGWTQNYIEANQDNIEVISWKIKRNDIIIGKLIRSL